MSDASPVLRGNNTFCHVSELDQNQNKQKNDYESFFSVLDDLEMYEEQKPFTLTEFCHVSSFLNHFMFKAIWNGLAGKKLLFLFGISRRNCVCLSIIFTSTQQTLHRFTRLGRRHRITTFFMLHIRY